MHCAHDVRTLQTSITARKTVVVSFSLHLAGAFVVVVFFVWLALFFVVVVEVCIVFFTFAQFYNLIGTEDRWCADLLYEINWQAIEYIWCVLRSIAASNLIYTKLDWFHPIAMAVFRVIGKFANVANYIYRMQTDLATANSYTKFNQFNAFICTLGKSTIRR